MNNVFENLKNILNNNGYPDYLIYNAIRKVLDKFHLPKTNTNNSISTSSNQTTNDFHNFDPGGLIKNILEILGIENNRSKENKPVNLKYRSILKLPFSEGSKELKLKILKLLPKEANLNVIFTTKRIIDLFSNKSATPLDVQSNLVYKFDCHGCNSSYIGETSRHLRTRVADHCRGVGCKTLFDHGSNCRNRNNRINISEFKIISKGFSNYKERAMAEAILIKSGKPDLNIQNKSVQLLKLF